MEFFPYLSIFDGDAYETPLGAIPVDKTIAGQIASLDPLFKLSESGHIQNQLASREHALEVQLPFLQAVLDRFRIVPIVMGDQSWEACRVLGDALGHALKSDNVVSVISSDLSHFYPYNVANEMDGVFLDLLQQMDPWRLYESVKERKCEACGAGPVISGLIAAQHFDNSACHVLSRSNSGDVTGDHDRVVGYACAVICEGDKTGRVDQEIEYALSAQERSYLLQRARAAIEKVLGVSPRETSECQSTSLDEKRGAFVTLKVRGRLRGCVGTIEPRDSIRDVTPQMAVAAAMSDPRFGTLTTGEIEHLHIEISILSPLREIQTHGEIQVGQHGLVVRNGPNSGLLLPQVAEERAWNAEQFLESTCEKAGLASDAWRDDSTHIFVFEATVFGEEKEFTH